MSEKFFEEGPSIEQKEDQEYEKEPAQEKDIVVTVMRHGESEYKDFQNVLKSGIARDKSLLPDLSEKGVENISRRAHELLDGIDKENEIVIIWTSPELRAIGTSKIIEDVLRENGVMVIKNSEISSLAEAHATPVGKMKLAPQKIHKYFDLSGLTEDQAKEIEEAKATMENPDIPFGEAWRSYAGTEKFEDVETKEASKKRFNRVINGLFLLKKIMKPKDPTKRLRFVCIVHEDLPDELLESAFEKGLINHKGLGNGESIELTIKSSKDRDLVNAEHQGETRELVFDREKREFVYEKKE